MPNNSFILPVIVFCLLIVSSCGGDGAESLSRDQAIDIAAHHLIGKSFDIIPPSTVTLAAGKYTVAFTRPVPGGAPGETYTSRVVFDAKTQEALEIEINTEKSVANVPDTDTDPIPDSTDLINRPTPLNEEVDQVEAIQKQFEKLGKP
jgi:hypothetical protein